jgi:hypothetical protein
MRLGRRTKRERPFGRPLKLCYLAHPDEAARGVRDPFRVSDHNVHQPAGDVDYLSRRSAFEVALHGWIGQSA